MGVFRLSCYASEIGKGDLGEKIAGAISRMLSDFDVASGRCVVFMEEQVFDSSQG